MMYIYVEFYFGALLLLGILKTDEMEKKEVISQGHVQIYGSL